MARIKSVSSFSFSVLGSVSFEFESDAKVKRVCGAVSTPWLIPVSWGVGRSIVNVSRVDSHDMIVRLEKSEHNHNTC